MKSWERQAYAEAQNYACAICKRHADLVVDHNHVSGEIRGLLCHTCNVGLGQFGDSIARLKAAADYLAMNGSYGD